MVSPISNQDGSAGAPAATPTEAPAAAVSTESVAKVGQTADKGGQNQGDKLDLSDDAKNLSKHQGSPLQLADGQYSVTNEVPEGAETETMASVTTQSGRTLTIAKVMFAGGQNKTFGGDHYGFQANVYDPAGKLEYSFVLKKDTILSEDEDGSLNVSDYTKGAETDGDDIIITQEGKDVSGGKGNDTIVDLYGKIHKGEADINSMSIDGGDGDDTIIVKGEMRQKTVNTGAGDDTIQSDGRIYHSDINTGEGDDTINVSGENAHIDQSNITMGDGDDTIVASNGVWGGNVDTGAGDDIISAHKGRIYSNIRTGNGNDKVLGQSIAGSLDTGEGDDTVEVREAIGGNIKTGAGNDVIKVADGGAGHIGGKIEMGAGDDLIDAKGSGVGFAHIDTGSGNDSVTVMDTYESTINLGSGDDSLTGRLIMHNTRINGGDGNDSFKSIASVLDSFIDMGAGDDMVYIAGDLANSLLAMGEGEEDSVFIGGSVSRSSSISGVKAGNLWIMGKRVDTIE